MMKNSTPASLSIIGAGSSYTPVLIHSMLQHFESFPFGRLLLMDVSSERLNIIGNYVKSQLDRGQATVRVDSFETLRPALENVDIVITLYRIGGLAGRHADICQAKKYGILGQETTGWGGFASAIRNIPLAVQITELLKEISPDSWLINITNPVGIITQACSRVRPRRTMGICEMPIRMVSAISEVLNRPATDLEVSYTGLNHLSWITQVIVDGEPVIDKLTGGLIEKILCKCMGPNIEDGNELINIAKALRAIPSPYLRYYYLADKMKNRILKSEKTRAEICMELDASLMRLYSQCDKEKWLVPASLRGGYLLGPTVASLVEELLSPGDKLLFPCITNENIIAFLPKQAIIEVSAKMKEGALSPGPFVNLHPHIRGLTAQIAAYEELTVEAGMNGDYEAGLAALTVHPLVASLSIAQKLLDETLEANRKFLPQFS